MKYKIEITETLQRILEVMASSEEDAIQDVTARYRQCDVVLDESDFVDVNIAVLEDDCNAVL